MEIRVLERDDLSKRVELLNNPAISRFLNTNEQFTLPETERWFLKVQADPTRHDFVFKDKEGSVVGMAGIVHISTLDKHAELYIYIDPIHQSKGYGKQGLRYLIDYSFEILGLDKVFVYTFLSNERANLFYEELGFVREALLRRHTFHSGKLQDRCIYSLFRD